MANLPEFDELARFESLGLPGVHFETLDTVSHQGVDYPLKAIVIGSRAPEVPTLGLFGGVHGLERIGSQVIIAFLHSLFEQLSWDKVLRHNFEGFRIVTIPIVNPVGLAHFTRSNGSGVDLMRNAPVEAKGEVLPLISGHRLGPFLPWYRGRPGVLEQEARVLIEFVRRELFPATASIALDVHSGFGMRDQLWYPYAKSREAFPRKPEALRLKGLLDRTYPHHIYKFEGQSDNYTTHGDLWDYLFDAHYEETGPKGPVFMPLTLELGSWNWVRKNPLQFFSRLGLFHPIKGHRHARIMRRHILLLDFLSKAVKNHHCWCDEA